jgi:hypothetical protein
MKSACEGKIPVKLVGGQRPIYMMVYRMGYLEHLNIQSIVGYSPSFVYNGVELPFGVPIGVLFDLLANTFDIHCLPWKLELKIRACCYISHPRHTAKESLYIRFGSAQRAIQLTESDWSLYNQSIINGEFETSLALIGGLGDLCPLRIVGVNDGVVFISTLALHWSDPVPPGVVQGILPPNDSELPWLYTLCHADGFLYISQHLILPNSN